MDRSVSKKRNKSNSAPQMVYFTRIRYPQAQVPPNVKVVEPPWSFPSIPFDIGDLKPLDDYGNFPCDGFLKYDIWTLDLRGQDMAFEKSLNEFKLSLDKAYALGKTIVIIMDDQEYSWRNEASEKDIIEHKNNYPAGEHELVSDYDVLNGWGINIVHKPVPDNEIELSIKQKPFSDYFCYPKTYFTEVIPLESIMVTINSIIAYKRGFRQEIVACSINNKRLVFLPPSGLKNKLIRLTALRDIGNIYHNKYGRKLRFEKVVKQKKGKLSLRDIKYDGKSATLFLGSNKCQIPPQTIMHDICSVMFKQKVNSPICWDEVYEKMNEREPETDDYHKMYDAVRRINRSVKTAFKVGDKLFTWEAKSIKRNF